MLVSGTHTAICKVCSRRIALYPIAKTLWKHELKGSRCSGTHTDRFSDELFITKREFSYRRISASELQEHAELPRRKMPGTYLHWRRRWQQKTGILPIDAK